MIEGNHQVTGGQYAAERIFASRTPPTALICSNDMTAIGILHTAHRLDRKIPQDLSLIGFDNLLLSEIVQPALATLNLSRKEIATRAFYALQSGREAKGSSLTSSIVPDLIIRSSTGQACKSARPR